MLTQAAAAPSVNANTWLAEAKVNAFHYRVFFLGLGIFTCDGYHLIVFGAAVPLLMKAFHMGPAQTGVIAAYAFAGTAIGSLLFGALADKIGRKQTIIICAALFSVCMGLSGFVNTPLAFGILRFVMGLGIGGSMPNSLAVSCEFAPSRYRTTLGGGVTGGMMLGGVLAALFAMWLFPLYGWQSVFFIGAVPLLALPLYFKFLPESPEHLVKGNRVAELRALLRKARPADPLPDSTTLEVTRSSGKAPVAAIFQEGRAFSTVLLWTIFFMNMIVVFGFVVWLPKLMMNAGWSLGSGLFILFMMELISLIGVYPFSLFADWIGNKPALVIAFLLAFVSLSLIPLAHNLVLLIILVGLAGIGATGGQGISNGYIGNFYPPAMRSTGVGMAFGIGRFGAVVGPVLMGVMMALHFSYQLNMIMLGVPGLLAAVCMLLVKEKYNFAYQQQELRRLEKVAAAQNV